MLPNYNFNADGLSKTNKILEKFINNETVKIIVKANKNSSGDETPKRDVTYLLSVYLGLFTTELIMTHPLPEHFSK